MSSLGAVLLGAVLSFDRNSLNQALTLAAEAAHVPDPDPREGCMLANADRETIGRGHTEAAGGPHADIMALRDALIQAGIKKVDATHTDPNPLVAGQSFARVEIDTFGQEIVPWSPINISTPVTFEKSRS